MLHGQKERENEAAFDERAMAPAVGMAAGGSDGGAAGGGQGVQLRASSHMSGRVCVWKLSCSAIRHWKLGATPSRHSCSGVLYSMQSIYVNCA